MAEIKQLADTSKTTVIDTNTTLADAARAAGDYDNSTELDLMCDIFLSSLIFSAAPSANIIVADLYVLPGDGAVSESYPEGGDTSTGTDDTPQAVHYVGSFETINPSSSVAEVLALKDVPLGPHGNRFVLENKSGQTMHTTYDLSIMPKKFQSV